MSLSWLRYPVQHLRGRRYPEPPHPYRNEFQRDRDRIVHARAFRRLEDKTQVFGDRFSDHFRNRLTHTIEVSQIARTLASALSLDEDFTEALALVHDIGHPPFAHAGEDELNRRMQAFGERFNHNVHALRIVEGFEQRYARFPGLNLTFEVREGMVKHSRDFEPGEIPELDEYLPGFRPPLEAQLIDLADEIAYNTADLDDAFSAGLFTVGDVGDAVPRFKELMETAEIQFPGAEPEVRFAEVLRHIINLLVSGLILGTQEEARDSGVQGVDDVRNSPRRLVRFTPETAETNRQLKSFLTARVYTSKPLIEERERASAQIERLFHYYLDHPDQLPYSHQIRTNQIPIHRVICDYIAGMTERFFHQTSSQIFSPSSR